MAIINCNLVVICAMIMAMGLMTIDASGDHHQPILGWIPTNGSPCKGSIAECLAGEEFELDSEISRRILATTKYISYGALQRNTVPCSRRGASYYNCQPGAQANPYNRGCSRITRTFSMILAPSSA
ncbi:rapid alkalinization factor-like isoform X2 [Durio zibethinus]|uniref:Rapid alkalinization factor-like isoform X2 n=2 Tax=Durio zibethinus TaxID=66656 RepID=A0A6P5YSF3_DURZI|nr:rapid alkalinization factor-like isoform X2 [Durio zibethinus]